MTFLHCSFKHVYQKRKYVHIQHTALSTTALVLYVSRSICSLHHRILPWTCQPKFAKHNHNKVKGLHHRPEAFFVLCCHCQNSQFVCGLPTYFVSCSMYVNRTPTQVKDTLQRRSFSKQQWTLRNIYQNIFCKIVY